MKNIVLFITMLVLISVSTFAAAKERGHLLKDSKVDFILFAGYTNGGDDLINVEYDDGDRDEVQAGGEALLGGGVVVSWQNQLELQLTAGYHFDSASADNGDASFDRYPLEALVFRRLGQHRIGGGLTLHLSPTAELDIDGFEKETVNFDAAPGLVLEYGYGVLDNVWLGARYTYIEYKSEGYFATSRVDGNHLGLMAYFRF